LLPGKKRQPYCTTTPKPCCYGNKQIFSVNKLNIEIDLIEEPEPNYETRKAMEEVYHKGGTKVKDSKELFTQLGI
jgi:hypothetical protein